MIPTSYTFKKTVEHTETLLTLPITKTQLAYRLVRQCDITDEKGRKHPKVLGSESQGIISQAILEKHISEGADFTSDLSLVSDETLEGIRRRGWSYEADEWGIQKPYDYIKSGKKGHLVRFDHGAHMLYDASGKVLPVGLFFEYISAYMDNKHYNLERAVEILKKNPNVDLQERRWGDGYIDNIPSYNASQGRDRCISFWWAPTTEEYRQLWTKCKELKGQYPSTNRYRAVFECDLLGLREGGAALHDTFYGPSDYDE